MRVIFPIPAPLLIVLVPFFIAWRIAILGWRVVAWLVRQTWNTYRRHGGS
jgi:hypothetical protein